MPDPLTRKDFPDHAWAVMKERYDRTPHGAMFHLEGAGKELIEKWEEQKDGTVAAMKPDKLSKMIARCIREESSLELPLEFSGMLANVPVFERREGHWYLTDELHDVPYFRKQGNLTMFRKTPAPFPE